MLYESIRCSWIENRISIEPDGYTRPCCGETLETARIANISEGITNAFNHNKLLQLRENLNTTGYSEQTDFACNRCSNLEKLNKRSLRINSEFLSDKRELKGIQFKLSNKCQLACAHCGPNLSTEWAKILNIKPHVTSVEIDDKLIHELQNLLPNLVEIKFTGGEPFLDPSHYKILESLKSIKKDHCNLIYVTNGLIKPRHELWQGFKSVRLTVSVDGYKDTYNWFRRNANWDDLCTSIDYLSKYTKIDLAFSVTPWTVNDYTSVKNHFSDMHVTPINIVVPKRSSLLNFPKNIAKKYFNDPYYINMTSENGNLTYYKEFAKYWDTTFNTIGWANKLFPWLNEI